MGFSGSAPNLVKNYGKRKIVVFSCFSFVRRISSIILAGNHLVIGVSDWLLNNTWPQNGKAALPSGNYRAGMFFRMVNTKLGDR